MEGKTMERKIEGKRN